MAACGHHRLILIQAGRCGGSGQPPAAGPFNSLASVQISNYVLVEKKMMYQIRNLVCLSLGEKPGKYST